MTNFNFTPSNCYEHLENINNVQVFLMSDSCPDHLKESLREHQLDLIEQLSTKLLMLKSTVSLEDKTTNQSRC